MFSGKAFILLQELKFYPGLESASVLVLDSVQRAQFLAEMCFVVQCNFHAVEVLVQT